MLFHLISAGFFGTAFKKGPLIARGATLNVPRAVITFVPANNPFVGRGRPFAATVHSPVADGQVTQPLLLQMSISPLSLTDHAQRDPLAVLSMHIPTAVLPSIASAGVGEISMSTNVAITDPKPMRRILCELRENID
jgi:hypothetical protein